MADLAPSGTVRLPAFSAAMLGVVVVLTVVSLVVAVIRPAAAR